MESINLNTLCDVIGGRLAAAAGVDRCVPFARVVTDSRQVQSGDVFWALPGKNRNGADFIVDAYRRGAVGVVAEMSNPQPPAGCWLVSVDDAQAALWELAQWRRQRFTGRVVGVTGSVGKTTTQRMIHGVLSERISGTASPRSYNNHVGVPLSILDWNDGADYAVVELGASAAGEIAALSRLSGPGVGVITAIGDAHLGGFGDQRGVARAKTELLTALPEDGWAVVNGDCPLLVRSAGRLHTNMVTFGRGVDCDVRADDVRCGDGRLRFRVDGRGYQIPVWGRHHLPAALASIAVGRIFGLNADEIDAGLAGYEPAPMRCQVRRVREATVIQDTYNASPVAMRAAFDLLRDVDAAGRRVVVCGDMGELGRQAAKLHREIGADVVCRAGADLLIACGQHASQVVAAARDAGMPPDRTFACEDSQQCATQLAEAWAAGDVILVKGSRGMAMETVVEALERPALGQAA